MISLSRPLKSNQLNQGFGENRSCINQLTKQVITKSGETCPIGYVDFYKSLNMWGHNGEDWNAWYGEPIYFNAIVYGGGILEGTCQNEIDSSGGKGVDVLFTDPVTQAKYKTRYWHLKDSAVYDGQKIKSGDLIGYADSTGASSGNDLHWSVKPQTITGENLYPQNGYTGAIDIRKYEGIKYYPDDFILTVLNMYQQLTYLQQIYKLYYLLLKK